MRESEKSKKKNLFSLPYTDSIAKNLLQSLTETVRIGIAGPVSGNISGPVYCRESKHC